MLLVGLFVGCVLCCGLWRCVLEHLHALGCVGCTELLYQWTNSQCRVAAHKEEDNTKKCIRRIVCELNISIVVVDFQGEADQEERYLTLKMKALPSKCR